MFFLTYSGIARDIRITKELIFEFLKSRGEVKYLCVGREDHNLSNSIHFHAIVDYLKKKDSKNPRYFDVSFRGKKYHPNLAKCPKRVDIK